MFEFARRPQLKAAPQPSTLRHKLKAPTPPASPMPSLFSGSPKQKTACSECEAARRPALERPPSDTQMRRGTPGEDPAERQADELGKRIGDDLSGAESVGHGPLPKSVQQVAESHLGVSLEGTHIDVGSGGQRKAKDESALAVTEGNQVAFGEGRLSTSSAEGRALLGHELVHVGQQSRHAGSSQRKDETEQPSAAPDTKKPKGLPSDPKSVTLKYVKGLVHDGDFGGALYVVRGRSIAQMLSWLDGISVDLGPAGRAAFKAAAAGAGGPRLDLAVRLAFAPADIDPWVWQVIGDMSPSERLLVMKYAKAKGVGPRCSIDLPGGCWSFEQWIETFPTSGKRVTGTMYKTEDVTMNMPSVIAELVAGAAGFKADCADVAMILRDYYLKAHNETQASKLPEFKKYTLGKGSNIVMCMNELNSASYRQAGALVDFYRKDGRNITDIDGLVAAGLSPGDVFVWASDASRPDTAGHIQTVRSISKTPTGYAVTFLQGTQQMKSGTLVGAGQVQYEHRVFGHVDIDPRRTPRRSSKGTTVHVETFVGAGKYLGGA